MDLAALIQYCDTKSSEEEIIDKLIDLILLYYFLFTMHFYLVRNS